MKHAQFVSIKKLTGKAIIEVAAKHNHREIIAELGATHDGHIAPARVALNRIIRGHSTAAAVAGQAQAMMTAAGVTTMRKDAVRALEIVFSLPPAAPVDHERFFNEAVMWAERYFAVPVISAIVHNDEAAPHCHALLLPLVDGRMIGSDLMGGRAKLQAMQADFHTHVGKLHGLDRQAEQARPGTEARRQAMALAFECLEANSGLQDALLRTLLGPHEANPAPLLSALGLPMPGAPVDHENTFAGIMTRPCKPLTLGFGPNKSAEKGQTLSCVGFADSGPTFSPPADESTSASYPPENALTIATQQPTASATPTASPPHGTHGQAAQPSGSTTMATSSTSQPQDDADATTDTAHVDREPATTGPYAPMRELVSAPIVPMQLGWRLPKFPKQFTGARADVLAAWLAPHDPACTEGIQGRLGLATVVRALIRKYHWRVERRDIRTSIGDGRTAWASVYCLPAEAIEAALSAEGRAWLDGYRAEHAERAKRAPAAPQGDCQYLVTDAEPTPRRRGRPRKVAP